MWQFLHFCPTQVIHSDDQVPGSWCERQVSWANETQMADAMLKIASGLIQQDFEDVNPNTDLQSDQES